MNELTKLFRETLSGDNGLYSAKKVQMFSAFFVCVVMAGFDMWINKQINLTVFGIFAGIAGIMPAISAVESKINNTAEK